MGSTREPWIKVKVGFGRSDKLAAFASESYAGDSERLGYLYLMLEAKIQRRMGVFVSRRHVEELLGRRAGFFDGYVQAGLLHIAPMLCTECARRHVADNLDSGNVVIHDYLLEQRDPTNAERQEAWRRAHQAASVTADVTAEVTPPPVTPDSLSSVPTIDPPSIVTPDSVTPASPPIEPSTANGDVTPDSRTRGMTVTVTETVRRRTKKDVLDEELERAASAPVRTPPVDDLDLSDLGRAGRPRASDRNRPLVVPPAIAAATPGWRLPCTNYVAHQHQHMLVDGQAVCPPCEEAAAAAGTFPPADRTADLWDSGPDFGSFVGDAT